MNPLLIIISVICFLALSVVLIAVLRVSRQVNLITRDVNARLEDNVRALLDTHKTVGERLDNVTNVITQVNTGLGKLSQSSQMIFDIGKNIAGLQELLRAPKFRGEFGEIMLEAILAQVLPKGSFSAQYKFKNGEVVDAVVELGERLVPVDSKFPWENFKRMLEVSDDAEKKQSRKAFIRDVKNRIDEIASKYILPDEKTYDFALMYIPAENVYYETIIKETEIMPYSISKKVIPVSPNTFYAYLMVICLGLKGMQVDKNAKEVIANLARLEIDIDKFRENFDLVGTHLTNAKTKYDEAGARLNRFSDKLISSSQVK